MKRILLLSLIVTIHSCVHGAEPKTIRLNFSDNESLELSQDYMSTLNQSNTLAPLFEYAQDDGSPIELQPMKKDIFEAMLPYMSILSNQELQGEQKKYKLYYSPLLSDQKLAAVVQASDFLNIPALTDVTINKLADRLLKADKLQSFIDDPGYLKKLNLNPVVEEKIAQAMQSLAKTAGIRATILQNVNVPYKVQVIYGYCWARSVAFSPDGKLLATVLLDNAVRILNVATGALVNRFEGTISIQSIVFSPDKKLLATRSAHGDVHILNVEALKQWTLKHRFTGHIRSIEFSPNGKLLAAGSDDRTVRIWDVETGTVVHMIAGHAGSVRSVTFSPNGKLLATGSDDGDVRIWNIEAGTLKHRLIGHTALVNSVVFSSDGNLLATGSDDRTVHIWNVETGLLPQILADHTYGVQLVSFSPDRKLLVTVSMGDNTVHIWNVETGALVYRSTDHTDWVRSVVFSANGKLLVIGSSDKTSTWSLENILHVQNTLQHLSLEQLLFLILAYEQREKIDWSKYPHLQTIYDSLDPSIQEVVTRWQPSMIMKMWQWLKGQH